MANTTSGFCIESVRARSAQPNILTRAGSDRKRRLRAAYLRYVTIVLPPSSSAWKVPSRYSTIKTEEWAEEGKHVINNNKGIKE